MKSKKYKKVIKKQQETIELLMNKKIIKGLISAIDDFKKGKYTIVKK